MTRAQKALTDATVRAIKPPSSGVIDVPDLRTPGLFLRITKAGAKSWSFRFTDPAGKRARMALAAYPGMGLADARERADEVRKVIAKGLNPIEVKAKARSDAATQTFNALADRYLKEHANRHKKTADTDTRNLKLHVRPKWGKRNYASIARADIIELIEGLIADGKPTLANRVHSLVSKIFSFAIDSDLMSLNPASRLKKRGTETALKRVLVDDEIKLFWTRITSPPLSPATGLALRLMLLTGLRAGEVAGLARSEITALDDADNAAILIPEERTKNGRAHLVPLAEMARAIVKAALKLAGESGYLFPSRYDDERAIDPHAYAKAMARFAGEFADDDEDSATWRAAPPTPHDLRRTFATRLSMLGVPKEDRDALLNHVEPGVGKKHYDQYDRAAEKRTALNAWASALARILGDEQSADVVPFRRIAQ